MFPSTFIACPDADCNFGFLSGSTMYSNDLVVKAYLRNVSVQMDRSAPVSTHTEAKPIRVVLATCTCVLTLALPLGLILKLLSLLPGVVPQ